MKLISSKRRMAVVGLTVGLVAGASGLAVAYFTSSGSGNGSAQTGTASNVTISQVGAGYDSLAPSYHQDQCFGCSDLTEFGNAISLAPGSGQLANVVVAFRSYGAATSSEPITLTLYSPAGAPNYVGGELTPYSSVTITPSIPQGDVTRATFEETFDFSHLDLTLSGPVVYGVSWTDAGGAVINVALSNSVSNLTVGSDQYPGYVFVNGTDNNSLSASGDAGSCATSTAGTFMATNINCATPGGNYGAYGPGSNPENADIPAVEFNVVGGSTAPLYPGGPTQPVDFAIINSGTPTHITSVTTSITGLTGTGSIGGDETCTVGMYSLNSTGPVVSSAVDPINATVPTGTSFYSPSGTVIRMIDDGNNQDNCENAVATLGFTSP
jgi:hypothetical protein